MENGELTTIISECNIQPGDLLMMDAYSDGTMNHSTIISSVDDDMLCYSAHSESRLDKPLIDALGGDVDSYNFHIIQIEG